MLAERVKVDLPSKGKIEIEKHELSYDKVSFLLTYAHSKVALEALKGFDEIFPASNDQIYQPDLRTRPTKSKVA